MKEEDIEERIVEIIENLNQLHDDSNKAVGFVLICGYEDSPKNKGIQFRVAGGGNSEFLALMMYGAIKDDKQYSEIFNAVVKLCGVGAETTEPKLIPFKLRPTINRGFK